MNDTEAVTINWGDGTATVNATVNQTTRTFTATHQYLDDSLPGAVTSIVNGQHAGTYTVAINDTDTDGGVAAQATTSVTVQNVAPVIGQLTVADASGAAIMTPNNPIVLSGTIVDPGTLDTHVVTINWGDGTTANPDLQTLNLAVGQLSFTPTHTYALPGGYNVSVIVTDKDGGTGSAP